MHPTPTCPRGAWREIPEPLEASMAIALTIIAYGATFGPVAALVLVFNAWAYRNG